jgi:hypothetical protein
MSRLCAASSSQWSARLKPGLALRASATALVATGATPAACSAGGCARAQQVDRDIEHGAGGRPDQLALWPFDLVMQSAQHIRCRARVVVLHESDLAPDGLVEIALVVALKEISAFVAQHARLEHDNFRNGETGSLHQNVSFITRSKY